MRVYSFRPSRPERSNLSLSLSIYIYIYMALKSKLPFDEDPQGDVSGRDAVARAPAAPTEEES